MGDNKPLVGNLYTKNKDFMNKVFPILHVYVGYSTVHATKEDWTKLLQDAASKVEAPVWMIMRGNHDVMGKACEYVSTDGKTNPPPGLKLRFNWKISASQSYRLGSTSSPDFPGGLTFEVWQKM